MSDENKCPKCWGCGLIASSEDGEPWSVWLDLPLGSSAAVLMGLVRPLPCPKCAPRPGDLIETECLTCKSGGKHSDREVRIDGMFPGHGGDRWVVQSVTSDRNGKIVVSALGNEKNGLPRILEYTGRNIKIIKRREELVADKLMEA